jgi:outer membrane protein assembly factor BamB
MDERTLSRRRLIASATAAGFAVAGGGVYLGSMDHGSHALAQGDQNQGPATPVPLGDVIPQEMSTETNWPYENYDFRATRDVKGSSINASSIGQLGDAWAVEVKSTAAFGSMTANPTIVGNTVFIQDASANIYAFKMDTGEQIWANMYNDVVPSGGPNGVTAAYGLLFSSIGGKGDVIALKQDSGEEVWRTNILGPMNEGITTPPLVYNNMVFISTIPGSSEGFYIGGQRGVIHALDAAAGHVIWYFDTTTDNLWGNPTVNSGGGFWHPPSVDDDGKLYIGVANPAPYPGVEGWPWASSRPGDNLYTDSILKMDPKTATLDWYLQVKPHDVFDLDNQLTPILIDVDGKKLAITSGKHGVVYAVDRDKGEMVWKTPVGKHQNDERTELKEDEVVEVWPGTLGGVETQYAYSAAENLIIAPVVQLSTTYIGTGFDPKTPLDFTGGTGLLIALNASDGSVAWQVDLATPPYAGVTICNDVCFTAGLDGVLLGYTVKDGQRVFSYQAPAGINAMTAASGDYLFVPAGGPLVATTESWNPLPDMKSQLIALKIGGTVQEQRPTGTPQATPEGGTEATPENSGVEPGGTPVSQTGAVQVDMHEFAFTPSQITIPANTDVQATFTNTGALPHNFTCDQLGLKTPDDPPGQSTTITINAAAGTYDFICSIPGHADAGMRGQLIVQ